MASIKQNVSGIIHAASEACAGAGVGLAQAPEADSAAVASIQIEMVSAIASEHGIEINHDAAADMRHKLAATAQSRQVHSSRQALAGWLPGIDGAAGDSTVAALTEAIGWAANSYFKQAESK